MGKKFRFKVGESPDPFRTKTEAKKFADKLRKKTGRRVEVQKTGLFGRSRGFNYNVVQGQKRK